jgi:prolyl-tRNA synthetase
MRASKLHLVTLRDDPADAEVLSHKLMVRAGYVWKVGGGLYTYGPLMFRVLQKVQAIIREELARIDALEIQMPILQEQALWEESGRWAKYLASRTMLTVKDRKETVYGLAPTAEEVVTAYARATARSYKQLPLCLFQIHTKFRDEIRPRFGLLRVKEFLMKDAYSFDVDAAGLDVSYERMREAYHRIFRRMGLEAFGVDADPGDIGGSGSMEFMLAADAGEDAILLDETTGYAANIEKASSRFAPPVQEAARPLRIESTPGIRTVPQLAAFFPDVPGERMVKTILCKAVWEDRVEHWAALIRGDQEVNEVKLKNHTGGLALQMLSDEEIAAETGAPQGFAGPIGIPPHVRVVADETVRGMTNFLCGVNRADVHALDVNAGRDFPVPAYADFRLARAGEPSPVGEGAPLSLRRGIEVGHIFKLGTKYSKEMKATFMDVNGREQPFVMGCYGIGVSRVAAAAVEQYGDERGIVWPIPIAPFEVVVAALGKEEDASAAAEALYAAFTEAGVDVLLDDRKLSPGQRLKDYELLGFPYVVLVGRDWAAGSAEVRTRQGNNVELLARDTLVETVTGRVRSKR